MTYRARPGDVYLLCSDGLTTMLKETQIAEALAAGGSLEAVVEKLIAEANEAGGRDNITIVAFRLDDDEAPVGAPASEPPGGEGATLIGPSAEDAGLSGPAIRERAEAERVALGGAAAAPAPAKRPRGRRALRVLVPALILAAVIAGAVYGIRQVYFLGSDSAGRVALYRGLPYDLPLGIKLYSEVYAAPVQVNSLPATRRQSAIDHTLRGHNDAVSLIDDLVKSANPPQPKPRQPKPRQPKPQRTKSAPRHRSQRSGGNRKQSGSGK